MVPNSITFTYFRVNLESFTVAISLIASAIDPNESLDNCCWVIFYSSFKEYLGVYLSMMRCSIELSASTISFLISLNLSNSGEVIYPLSLLMNSPTSSIGINLSQ